MASLDGMLVHEPVTPAICCCYPLFYTVEWRKTKWSKESCLRKHKQGLNPDLHALRSEVWYVHCLVTTSPLFSHEICHFCPFPDWAGCQCSSKGCWSSLCHVWQEQRWGNCVRNVDLPGDSWLFHQGRNGNFAFPYWLYPSELIFTILTLVI